MRRCNETVQRPCWCGQSELDSFSPDYRLCSACGTLVSQHGFLDSDYQVQNDEADFYGKGYWLDHQHNDLGLPRIEERARLDLPERCLHWLKQILTYRLPPANVLELGASHGAFVSLLKLAGFDATGLELSPWVAEYARKTFGVAMLIGPLEKQPLAAGSLDIVVANDVMEHLPDPVSTIRTAVSLLKPDGMLVLQMPDFVEGKKYEERVADEERFLDHARKPTEHLYLYSKRAARMLLNRAGLEHIEFRPAFFSDYDMYLFASRKPMKAQPEVEVSAALERSPQGRWARALLDKAESFEQLSARWRQAEADRNDRLQAVERLNEQLEVSEADRTARLASVQALTKRLVECEVELAAALHTSRAHEQTIKECRETIQSLRMAMGQEAYPPWRVRVRKSCDRMAKTVAKAVLPHSWRKWARKRMEGEEDQGKKEARVRCIES